MSPLAREVLAFVQRERLAAPGDRVVAALSGGPDSVALTLILSEILPRMGATLVGLAHLHHGLRGQDADADEAFSRAFGDRLGLECIVDHVDAGAWARLHRVSIESAGHRLRQAFFSRVREQLGATSVATGHSKNDQAETVLMHALRGAGLRGLSGIRPSRPGLIRPLLEVNRAQIVADLRRRGEAFREDASNLDTTIPRNRVRRDVLPLVERLVSPRAQDALARIAWLASAEDDYLESVVNLLRTSLVQREGDAFRIGRSDLAGLPLALGRRLVCSLLESLGSEASASKVDGILAGARHERPLPAQCRGVRIGLADSDLVFRRFDSAKRVRARQSLVPVELGTLVIPGRLSLPDGAVLEASIIEVAPGFDRCLEGGTVAVLDAAQVSLPLRVRSRKPGDRMRPLGLEGHKKLQDLLVDRKVPRNERDSVPVLVAADGQIVWVAGHVITHHARVTSSTTSMLLLQYRR